MTAIKREFTQNGTTEDRANLNKVLTGTTGDGKTLDVLMVHASTTVAGLQRYHVLALRLYTTSSYRRLNDPLDDLVDHTPEEVPAHRWERTAWVGSVSDAQMLPHEGRPWAPRNSLDRCHKEVSSAGILFQHHRPHVAAVRTKCRFTTPV